MFVLRIRDAAQPACLRNFTAYADTLNGVYSEIEWCVAAGMVGRPFSVSYEPDTDTDDNGWRTLEVDPFDEWFHGADAVHDAYADLMAA